MGIVVVACAHALEAGVDPLIWALGLSALRARLTPSGMDLCFYGTGYRVREGPTPAANLRHAIMGYMVLVVVILTRSVGCETKGLSWHGGYHVLLRVC